LKRRQQLSHSASSVDSLLTQAMNLLIEVFPSDQHLKDKIDSLDPTN
jgi:hypothetical protein